MASLLRQVVAGPRAKHPEAGLDLCYVTDNIIATSGPSQTYPQRAYRNPLDRLVTFLDAKHGDQWAIWEFRAEGTGYPDSLVYDRVRHYPWPDHHPPPFGLVPLIVESMRGWMDGGDLFEGDNSQKKKGEEGDEKKKKKGEEGNKRVVVVHCKAGKGRSGTMACSYLISQCGWTAEQALARFTERRMRPRFGPGVSIPSQLRWVGYVERWAKEQEKTRRKYVDRPVEVLEVRVWGLRNGVKVAVEGFVENGKVIKALHTFSKRERNVLEAGAPGGDGLVDMFYDMAGYGEAEEQQKQEKEGEAASAEEGAGSDSKRISRTSSLLSKVSRSASTRRSRRGKKIGGGSNDGGGGGGGGGGAASDSTTTPNTTESSSPTTSPSTTNAATPTTIATATGDEAAAEDPGGRVVVFRPEEKTGPIRVPTSDINITLERRHRAPSAVGLTMVTAVAHVWFNVWFEGGGPEAAAAAEGKEPEKEGVFGIDWDQMDGIKGSGQKGTRAAERVEVVWRVVGDEDANITTTTTTTTTNTTAAATKEADEGGEAVPQMPAADWDVEDEREAGLKVDPDAERHLGLRTKSPDASEDVSLASSVKGGERESSFSNNTAGLGAGASSVAAAAAAVAMGSTTTAAGGSGYGGEDPTKGVKSDAAAPVT